MSTTSSATTLASITPTTSLATRAAIMTSSTLKSTTPRDYSAAFGELSSTYGFTGSMPSPIPTSMSSFFLPKLLLRRRAAKQGSDATHSAPTPTNSTASPIYPSRSSSDSDRTLTGTAAQKQKNYEHAFSTLVSSYGFGSSIVPVPTVPSRLSK